MFLELQRYAGMLRLPAVAAALSGELKEVEELVDQFLEGVQAAVGDRSGGHGGREGAAGRNLSSVADDIAWVAQARRRELCWMLSSSVIALRIGLRVLGIAQHRRLNERGVVHI